MIKAKEIYENALALNPKYNPNEPCIEHCVVDKINQVLVQALIYNKLKRATKGKDEQLEMPYIKDIDDKIDFEIEFYAPLSYGLAALIAKDLGDTYLANLYEKQFYTLCIYA